MHYKCLLVFTFFVNGLREHRAKMQYLFLESDRKGKIFAWKTTGSAGINCIFGEWMWCHL